MKNSTLTKLVIVSVILSGLTFLIIVGMIVALISQSGSLSEGLKTIDKVWNKGFNMSVDKNIFEANQGSIALLPTNFLTDSMHYVFSTLQKNPDLCSVENLLSHTTSFLGKYEDLLSSIPVTSVAESTTCPNNRAPCVCPGSVRNNEVVCENSCDPVCKGTLKAGVEINCGVKPSQSQLVAVDSKLSEGAYYAYFLKQLGFNYTAEISEWNEECQRIWGIHHILSTVPSQSTNDINAFQALSQLSQYVPGCDGGSGSGTTPTKQPVYEDYLPYIDNSTGQYVSCIPDGAALDDNKQVFKTDTCTHTMSLCGKVPIGDATKFFCVGQHYHYKSILPLPTGSIKLPSTNMDVIIPPMKD